MKLLLASLVALAFTSCAPDFSRPSLRPVLIKLSEAAKIGETVSLQGRYLGSKDNATVIFNADPNGNNGITASAADVIAWGASEIQVKIPNNARPGGAFVFVSVGGTLSNGLPYSITK